MRNNSVTQSGFTLLEMVIVLGIVSALIGTFFSFYQPTRNSKGYSETARKQERVMNALSNYVLTNNKLPCPADPAEADPNKFGSPISNCNYVRGGSGFAFNGIIPFRSIGFSPRDVQDGFGNYMTYDIWGTFSVPKPDTIAEQNSTSSSGVQSEFCRTYPKALDVAYDGVNQGHPADSSFAASRDPYAVAIISHGQNGFGGYNVKATNPSDRALPIGRASLDTALGTYERYNAVDKSPEYVNDGSYNEQSGSSHFDDQILYLDGPGIIARLGITGCHDLDPSR